ncbi:MAG TPA: hypothetical protein VK464_20120 [Symbiobacteriaceae bacterium]|nr:hypothetical protein [Symbiobacteriaceae bacterium]
MGKRTWSVTLSDGQHIFELDHGYWSGKRRISVDGQLVHEGGGFIKVWAAGARDQFTVGIHHCVVEVKPNFRTNNYDYALWVDGVPKLSTAEQEALQQVAATMAARGQSWARETYGAQWDFSLENLAGMDGVVDRITRDWSDQGVTPGHAEWNQAAKLIGFYLGETLRRHFGGTWIEDQTPEGKPAFVLLIPGPGDMRCNVIGQVYKRLAYGPEHSIGWLVEQYRETAGRTKTGA